ncbi:toll/interleukin-1 receptor domain-containing protein [Gaiella sp.]|uniref:toll/interleukin-1 receptor domain-containing protein n=1 Tax=Gaiella sp. TaxID=2663207 RepID=UPI003982F3B7
MGERRLELTTEVHPSVADELRSLPGQAARTVLLALQRLREEPWLGRQFSLASVEGGSAARLRVLHVDETGPSSGTDAGYRVVYELLPEHGQVRRIRILTVTRSARHAHRLSDTVARETADFDFFIAYAWEDAELARALATELRDAHQTVWLSDDGLKLGDSLSSRIDRAITSSRHGIVILSPAFLHKAWPSRELAALGHREASGERVVLPIWHNVTLEDVARYAPPLADRLALVADDKTPRELAQAIVSAAAARAPTSGVAPPPRRAH